MKGFGSEKLVTDLYLGGPKTYGSELIYPLTSVRIKSVWVMQFWISILQRFYRSVSSCWTYYCLKTENVISFSCFRHVTCTKSFMTTTKEQVTISISVKSLFVFIFEKENQFLSFPLVSPRQLLQQSLFLCCSWQVCQVVEDDCHQISSQQSFQHPRLQHHQWTLGWQRLQGIFY